jgi:hypothetical protein
VLTLTPPYEAEMEAVPTLSAFTNPARARRFQTLPQQAKTSAGKHQFQLNETNGKSLDECSP